MEGTHQISTYYADSGSHVLVLFLQ